MPRVSARPSGGCVRAQPRVRTRLPARRPDMTDRGPAPQLPLARGDRFLEVDVVAVVVEDERDVLCDRLAGDGLDLAAGLAEFLVEAVEGLGGGVGQLEQLL